MPGGQPTKLTPEVQAALCDAIRAGNYYAAACARARVTYATFLNWMRRGRQARSGLYFTFFGAVRAAQADAESAALAHWQAAIPEDWRAARDFLARRFPARWGPKDSHDVSLHGKGKGGAIPIVAVEVVTSERPDRAEAGPVGDGAAAEVQLPPGPAPGVGQ